MARQSVVEYLLAFCLLITGSLAELETDASSVIYLSHSLGSRALESRGQINVKSLKSGSVNIQQDSSYDWKDYREAAEANDFYHLEALVKYNGIERTFLTSTKACLLFESQLADIITIHVDLLGNIYGVSVATPHNQKCAGDAPEFDPTFNTTVLISYMEHGPIPDVAMFVQKVEQEKVAKERGETKDNRSFIAKYWMYIVPLVLVFMMSGASNPEQPAR
ncbi:ER membrane protein complex subunit 10-like [Daphnia pulicaria]|uniref:ER membrane protein complex subunit 10-like n=1 Tax=Daphnia pulicaria TaxID=35523 RepID=UPI001EE9CD2D|nr:ER membrane protein complex subunit 10-like [Daphnia pulicaria]